MLPNSNGLLGLGCASRGSCTGGVLLLRVSLIPSSNWTEELSRIKFDSRSSACYPVDGAWEGIDHEEVKVDDSGKGLEYKRQTK